MKKQGTKSTKKAKASSIAPGSTDVVEAPQETQNQLKVDIEYIKTTDIHFVVYCPEGNIAETTFISFAKFSSVAKQIGLEWSVETTINETNSSQAKNMLVAKFMQLENKTHIMFVDSQIGFEPWHVLLLLDSKKDVIGGLTPAKSLPIKWSVTTFEGAEETPEGLHEVDKISSTFMLVSRAVFEKLKEHDQVKQYKNTAGLGEEFDKELYTYFNSQYVNDFYASDDTVFSALARASDFKLWIDKRVVVTNKGYFNYSAMAQDVLLNSFGTMYLDYMKNNGKIQVIETTEENTTE